MRRTPAAVPLRACLAALLLTPACAGAAAVNVVGLFPGKAVVSIDGAAPRTLAVGQKTPEGVTLTGIAGDSATFDIDGARRSVRLGEAYSSPNRPPGGETLTLSADSGGHYATVGAINDRAVRFFVDTGASLVWMSAEVANRIGLSYRGGTPITANTAGGQRTAYSVRLASVRVGNIVLTDVEGAVGEGAGTGDMVLLGMSFLSRLSMARDGDRLRLSRREGAAAAADTRPRLTLKERRAGLFATQAAVNGVPMSFLVDTGATSVSLDASMAQRIGLNYQNGTPLTVSTANGPVRAWRVKLDQISAGPIMLYNVDATVLEGPGVGVGLLGMSFLNRVEIRRDGETMVLIKRF